MLTKPGEVALAGGPLTASPESSRPTVTVAVVPAFNEERFIAGVVITARHYASHVIVIDDGSNDRTAELAEAGGAVVVRLPVNSGKARAINAGFDRAREFNPDVVVCLDGDAQHEPSDIPKVIEPILADRADVVIGSRFLGIKNEAPKWRAVGQRTMTVMTNTLSGVRVSDSQSGYRAFSPRALATLVFHTGGLSVESEMQFLFQGAGLRVVEVPVTVKYRDGNKRNPLVHGMQVVDAMLTLVARRRPLMLVSLPGLILSAIGLVAGLFVTLRISQTGDLMVGTSMLTLLLIIIGLLLAVTGVVLHSISSFFDRLREELVLQLNPKSS